MIRSKAIRRSARGETCTFQIAGVCRNETDTTVLCHIQDEGGKMGGKSSDTSAAYGCLRCHQVVDGVVRNHEYMENRWFYNYRARERTLNRLVDKGIVKVKS